MDTPHEDRFHLLPETLIHIRMRRRAISPAWSQMEACSICCNELCEGEAHTLPCKHGFHAACIIEWFRRGYDTCPMCRASKLTQRALTPTERWAQLRRKAKTLPPEQRRLLSRYDMWKSKCVEAKRSLIHFRRETMEQRKAHSKIFSRLRVLQHRRMICVRKMSRIQHALTSTACPTVPMATVMYESSDDSL